MSAGNSASPAESQEFYVKLGKNIREARERRGLTQASLASLIQLTRSSVANVERGRQKLLAHHLARVAKALRFSADELLPSQSLEAGSRLDHLLQARSENERQWISKALAEGDSQ